MNKYESPSILFLKDRHFWMKNFMYVTMTFTYNSLASLFELQDAHMLTDVAKLQQFFKCNRYGKLSCKNYWTKDPTGKIIT